jgi:phytoene dehydrogenase-like protein
MPGIVIVGAGFGGIAMGVALKKAGYHDCVILDKAHDLGGTWRDNQYPGCACDVPSPLYSYSFELNPDWSHLFAPQQEIWDYLRNCARKHGLDEHIRYGTAVERMDWDDEIQHVLSCLRRLARDKADVIEVSEAAQRRYNDTLQRRLRRAVWSEGGCDSWYLDADGVNRTLWPGFTFEYWARTRRACRAGYQVTAS